MLTVYPLAFLGPWEIAILALVVILLFGGKKIPEFMKGLGKGIRSFKQGMDEGQKEIDEAKSSSGSRNDKADQG